MLNNKTYTLNETLSFNNTEVIMSATAKEMGSNFYHYTTVKSLKEILVRDEKGNRFFFVSNIGKMNDLIEAKLHKKNADRIHSFCTCCTKHEKIPLWYLYSGIRGNGARIGITPGKMLKFLSSIEVVYPVVNGQVDYDAPMQKGNDFRLECGWVLYIMDGNNRIIYKNSQYAIEKMTESELSRNLFVKKYPWHYESEFRIIIYNNGDRIYDKIAIKIPDEIVSSFEIMSAPEYKFTKNEKQFFENVGISREKIKESKLQIQMDLLNNNIGDIFRYLDELYEKNDDKVCEYLYKKVSSIKEEKRK